MSTEIRTEFVEANGLRFEVLTCGDPASDTLALCLHGFPEVAESWRLQMLELAAMGYRVWAPNQRGYGQTSRPEGMEAYALENLVADVAGLIDASDAERVVLLAHDWGGIVAWTFAMRQPLLKKARSLERLVIINVPHPAAYLRNLRLGQMLRSWFVLLFQLPRLPEWWLGRDGARAVSGSIVGTSTARARLRPELLAAVQANAAQPGALRAMIHWYRAFVRGGGLSRQRALGWPKITVPTLLLWGDQDRFLAKYTTDGTDAFVEDLTLEVLPGVSHWVQQDAPEACNAALRRFLGGIG